MANNEISLEEHIYNAFRIDVMEHKIVMLEKKIIDMTKHKQESNSIQPVQVLFMFILFTIINKII